MSTSRLIAWTVVLFAAAGAAQGAGIALYDADTGDPPDAAAIVDPTTAAGGSWLPVDTSLGGTDVQEGIIDGGVNAWRNKDGTNGNNPGYKKALTAANFTDMHDNGWQYTVNTKIVQNGHFTAWGLTTGNDPTWGLAARERSGFSFDKSGTAMRVTPVGGRRFTLGTDSADSFHELKNVGAADVSRFRTYIDDSFAGTWDFRDGSSNSSNDNIVMWASGSSGGANREAYFNEVRLETTTSAASSWNELFYDNFQSYSTGQGQTSFGPWIASGVTAGRASEIFNAGTGGSGINSRTWITDDLTKITADLGEAESYRAYELSAMLSAGTSNAGALTDFEMRLLVGPDAGSAVAVATLADSAIGGNLGKGSFDRQFLLSYDAGVFAPGDRLFIEIEHTESDFFLVVDDVALWSAVIPEPTAFSIWALGLLGLGWFGRRRRRKP